MILEIVLGLLVITDGYVIWNLNKKTELLETWVENFSNTIQTIQEELQDIDSRGVFESDDEIGAIFKQIKQTVNQLQSYIGEE